MMKKSYILLIVLISNLFGQTFTGNVKDVSGTEISYVVIEELNYFHLEFRKRGDHHWKDEWKSRQ